MSRPAIDINIHDSSIGIWQDNAQDPSFRAEIYDALVRDLRARGWSIKADPKIHRHYRSISPCHRLGTRGTLCCKIEVAGRHVGVEFWSLTAPQINRNGRRYDFDKLSRMGYLDRLRVEVERARICRWLRTLAPAKVTLRNERHLSPMDRIQKGYAEGWHTDKGLGRPNWHQDYNRKSGDGGHLEHGQVVWLADRKGRIIRGTAYYNLNSMWWVIAGGQLMNESCGSLFVRAPDDLRTKQNERDRRKRLEAELSVAVQRMNFVRAEVLKQILFGGDQVFLIWARDHNSYYRSQYSGYATDSNFAGKYTRAEAEAECRRVPHELEMVGPDGKHISFQRGAA
jgi:hypothetical protein